VSPVGWPRFVERVARWGGVSSQRGNVGGSRPWQPRSPAVGRRPRRTSGRAEVGRWDQLVDEGPTGSRLYAVYTPPGLRPGMAVPLVVVLHGCNQSAEDVALGTGVNTLADRTRFVAVYPEQSVQDNPRRCWNWFDRDNQIRGSGEPAAIARITERVLSWRGEASLDRNRVHVMGISAGGAMAGILAATYPDLYASVGIHSAPQYRAARNAITALLAMRNGGPDPERQAHLAYAAMGPRARVVPVIVVQGEADRIVWAANGERVVRQWLATSRLVSGQATGLDFARPEASHDDCAPGGLSYSVRSWNDNAGRPVVEYWSVFGLGHAWSGGAGAGSYTDPRGPSATEAMCNFFGRCPLDHDVAAAAAGVDAGRRRGAVVRTVKELGRRLLRLPGNQVRHRRARSSGRGRPHS
jgi:poly(hydroxyalkanoate) depolymerase family esterase